MTQGVPMMLPLEVSCVRTRRNDVAARIIAVLDLNPWGAK